MDRNACHDVLISTILVFTNLWHDQPVLKVELLVLYQEIGDGISRANILRIEIIEKILKLIFYYFSEFQTCFFCHETVIVNRIFSTSFFLNTQEVVENTRCVVF